jgi:DNA-directed RNA polymerase subunit N (RpoN/RPB10)
MFIEHKPEDMRKALDGLAISRACCGTICSAHIAGIDFVRIDEVCRAQVLDFCREQLA